MGHCGNPHCPCRDVSKVPLFGCYVFAKILPTNAYRLRVLRADGVFRLVGKVLRGKKVAVWGLAFKPNTDDVRFAPSIALVRVLLAEGAAVRAYDPEAVEKARAIIPEVTALTPIRQPKEQTPF